MLYIITFFGQFLHRDSKFIKINLISYGIFIFIIFSPTKSYGSQEIFENKYFISNLLL